ncbi:hypothetical protein ACFSCZ_13760 [Siminovitchia sediminis]|uniref:Uncharacterized protein n=1 Tax=Siminovitchia sediminis TaxID=1274353 RepID=A0ABW4KL64_9BACI
MEITILLGLIFLLTVVGLFLVYAISSGVKAEENELADRTPDPDRFVEHRQHEHP